MAKAAITTNSSTADSRAPVKAVGDTSKAGIRGIQEDLVDALSALLKARDILRSVGDNLLAHRTDASPWQQQTGAMAALSAAQLDERIEELFKALRSVRIV